MKENERLLPCLNCGEKPRVRPYRTYSEKLYGFATKYYVWCGCGAEAPELGYEDRQMAIDEWNEVMRNG